MSTEAIAGDALASSLAVVLLCAAYLKLRYRSAFATSISTWGFPVRVLTGGLSVGVPLVELVVASSLLAGVIEPQVAGPGRLSASLLFFTFVLAQLAVMRAARPATCGCFGRPREISVATTARAAVFGVLAVLSLAI